MRLNEVIKLFEVNKLTPKQHPYIFPTSLLKSVRLFKPRCFFSKFLNVLPHLLILRKLLTQIIHKLPEKTFAPRCMPHLQRDREGCDS